MKLIDSAYVACMHFYKTISKDSQPYASTVFIMGFLLGWPGTLAINIIQKLLGFKPNYFYNVGLLILVGLIIHVIYKKRKQKFDSLALVEKSKLIKGGYLFLIICLSSLFWGGFLLKIVG